MNRLQRKIKRLDESIKKLMNEATMSTIRTSLINLLGQYINFLNGGVGKNDKEFKNQWRLALNSGTEGYKRDDGSEVKTLNELKAYLIETITSACNSLTTGEYKLKGQPLTSKMIYKLILNNPQLGLRNSLEFALSNLQIQKAIKDNDNLDYKQALELVQKNPLVFTAPVS